MSLPLVGVIASFLFFGKKRKKKEMQAAKPLPMSAARAAGQAFDQEFARSGDDDQAAEKAIEAYQRSGGKDPEFIAQIQYWTGSR